MDEERIRKISNGVITTVAGTGTPGFSGVQGRQPTPSSTTRRQSPGPRATCISRSSAARCWRCRRGDKRFCPEPGQPDGVAADLAGNVYICDRLDNVILKVSPAGAITALLRRIIQPGLPSTALGMSPAEHLLRHAGGGTGFGRTYPNPGDCGGAYIGDGGFATELNLCTRRA